MPADAAGVRDAAGRRESLAMIGGGRMALALAEGFCRAGLATAGDITVHDPDPGARERLDAAVPGVRFVDSPAAAAAAGRIVVLAVKPQQAADACRSLAAGLRDDATVVSIVAGLTIETLAALLDTPRVVRVMPNTPCLVGHGVSALAATRHVPSDDRHRIVGLLSAVGHVHEVDESLMDAVTGLSGSGPGFVARFVEALAAGGVAAGLPEPLALALAVQTVAGTGALLETTGEHPATVRERVTSPGGTTLAGLALLDSREVPDAIAAAVVRAAARAGELGASLRSPPDQPASPAS